MYGAGKQWPSARCARDRIGHMARRSFPCKNVPSPAFSPYEHRYDEDFEATLPACGGRERREASDVNLDVDHARVTLRYLAFLQTSADICDAAAVVYDTDIARSILRIIPVYQR